VKLKDYIDYKEKYLRKLFNEELDCFIGIPSKGRSFRVKEQEKLMGVKPTWFVPKEDFESYRNAGANSVEISPIGLSNSRNFILDYAFKNNQTCLMVDDDIIGYQKINNDKTLQDISFNDIVVLLKREINIFKLAGVNEKTNLFYYDPTRPISKKVPIICTLLVKPSAPRFDNNLKVAEDYDFTLQHLSKYGAVIRLNGFRNIHHGTQMDNKKLTFKSTISGGVNYSLDIQKDSFNYIMKKWKNRVMESKSTPYQIRIK